ncbi:toxin subunit protein [Colletotrichum tofieldiae]|nr:toxin subunit protein [Colletotrichum tofieldiae]
MSIESVIEVALDDEQAQKTILQLLKNGKDLDGIIDRAPAQFHGRLSFPTIQAIIRDNRANNLRSVAYLYFSEVPELPPTQVDEWRRRLFQLEPTAVLKALVDTEDIALAAEEQPLKRDITRQPFRDLTRGYRFPADTPAAIQAEALARVKEMQRLQALVPEPCLLGRLWGVLQPQQRSAQYIASVSETDFVKYLTTSPRAVPKPAAYNIHRNAVSVRMRSEQIWASLLRSKTQLRLPALESKPEVKDVDDGTTSYVNIFLRIDSVEFDSTESVLSPVAYLVDLLKTLSEVQATEPGRESDGGVTLLDCLSWRRPDLQDLELSTANTMVLIPYIDLFNEVLESFIANSSHSGPNDLVAIPAQNMQSGDTSAECEQQPHHINSEVYQDYIQPQFYPLTSFPTVTPSTR